MPTTPAENGAGLTMTSDQWLGALADAWDFGYACGLGDYGKSDDETQAANPYRVTRQ